MEKYPEKFAYMQNILYFCTPFVLNYKFHIVYGL